MSPRAIVAVLISSAIAVGIVIFLQTPAPPPPSAPSAAAINAVPLVSTDAVVPSVASTNTAFFKTNSDSTTTSEHLNSDAKIEQLQELAMNDDSVSLNSILGALTDPAPDVRAAAREAAIQFGDPKAAGPLREAATKVDDLEEKVALLDAAKYLELPSFRSPATTNNSPRP